MIPDFDRVKAVVAEMRRHVDHDPLGPGPVPLARYFAETGLDHVELPALTRGTVAEHLQREGVPAVDLGDPADQLAGFVFTAGRVGWAFIRASDLVGRRRFSAAHELGHFALHRTTMGQYRADTDTTLREADDDVADGMEKEANRFAVELLMPSKLCEARAQELRDKHGCCPLGVLIYRLSSELLVSREALKYRLQSLEVCDE